MSFNSINHTLNEPKIIRENPNVINPTIWYFLCPATNKRCRKLYSISGNSSSFCMLQNYKFELNGRIGLNRLCL